MSLFAPVVVVHRRHAQHQLLSGSHAGSEPLELTFTKKGYKSYSYTFHFDEADPAPVDIESLEMEFDARPAAASFLSVKHHGVRCLAIARQRILSAWKQASMTIKDRMVPVVERLMKKQKQ